VVELSRAASADLVFDPTLACGDVRARHGSTRLSGGDVAHFTALVAITLIVPRQTYF